MLSSGFKELIAPQAKVLNLIWLAFLFATLVYVAIAFLMAGPGDAGETVSVPPAETGTMPLNGMGLALMVVLGIGATYYQKTALGTATLKKKIPAEPVWPPVGSPMTTGRPGEPNSTFDALPDSEKRLAGLWPHYQTTLIVVWAMLEAMALVGLVLAIVQGEFLVVIPFAAAAGIMLFLKRPRPAGFFEGLSL